MEPSVIFQLIPILTLVMYFFYMTYYYAVPMFILKILLFYGHIRYRGSFITFRGGKITVECRKDGKLTVTAANQSAEKDIETSLTLLGAKLGKHAVVTTLANDNLCAHNTFDAPDRVAPTTAVYEQFDGILQIPRGGIVSVTSDIEE